MTVALHDEGRRLDLRPLIRESKLEPRYRLGTSRYSAGRRRRRLQPLLRVNLIHQQTVNENIFALTPGTPAARQRSSIASWNPVSASDTSIAMREPSFSLSDLPVFLKAEEVAELLRVDRKTVYEAARRDEIPGVVRVGRILRFRRDAVLAWVSDERPQPHVAASAKSTDYQPKPRHRSRSS